MKPTKASAVLRTYTNGFADRKWQATRRPIGWRDCIRLGDEAEIILEASASLALLRDTNWSSHVIIYSVAVNERG